MPLHSPMASGHAVESLDKEHLQMIPTASALALAQMRQSGVPLHFLLRFGKMYAVGILFQLGKAHLCFGSRLSICWYVASCNNRGWCSEVWNTSAFINVPEIHLW